MQPLSMQTEAQPMWYDIYIWYMCVTHMPKANVCFILYIVDINNFVWLSILCCKTTVSVHCICIPVAEGKVGTSAADQCIGCRCVASLDYLTPPFSVTDMGQLQIFTVTDVLACSSLAHIVRAWCPMAFTCCVLPFAPCTSMDTTHWMCSNIYAALVHIAVLYM